MVERLELNIGKNEWNVTSECSLASWESGSYNLRLPYSGKFSHGANFQIFRGMLVNAKIKNKNFYEEL